MKKYFAVLTAVFLFYSCDDGDFTLETFNFDNEISTEKQHAILKFKAPSLEMIVKAIIKK
jgi:hypothetical protein